MAADERESLDERAEAHDIACRWKDESSYTFAPNYALGVLAREVLRLRALQSESAPEGEQEDEVAADVTSERLLTPGDAPGERNKGDLP